LHWLTVQAAEKPLATRATTTATATTNPSSAHSDPADRSGTGGVVGGIDRDPVMRWTMTTPFDGNDHLTSVSVTPQV
jgi:hypothetical protein